jgi:hypothetical protein
LAELITRFCSISPAKPKARRHPEERAFSPCGRGGAQSGRIHHVLGAGQQFLNLSNS